MDKPFLHTEWRKLIMINYEVNPDLLQPYLPYGTTLDSWNGKCFVSVVGFKFINTKVKGIKFPFHIDFEQVNLRFYVKRKDGEATRHGVVFIKEIIDKPIVKWVANSLYKENYERLPMKSNWLESKENLNVNYQWKIAGKWNEIEVNSGNQLVEVEENSEEQFISEHYWGYIQINDKKSYEFQVEHEPWKVYSINRTKIDIDFKSVYGESFDLLRSQTPSSILLAEGSEVLLGDRKLIMN